MHNSCPQRLQPLIRNQPWESRLDVDGWLGRQESPVRVSRNRPKSRSTSVSVSRHGSQNGPLAGETVVFTGALSRPRHRMADLAAAPGCTVRTTVGKSTTILVVGSHNNLRGRKKSGKQRAAERAILRGQRIQLLTESSFCSLVGEAGR